MRSSYFETLDWDVWCIPITNSLRYMRSSYFETQNLFQQLLLHYHSLRYMRSSYFETCNYLRSLPDIRFTPLYAEQLFRDVEAKSVSSGKPTSFTPLYAEQLFRDHLPTYLDKIYIYSLRYMRSSYFETFQGLDPLFFLIDSLRYMRSSYFETAMVHCHISISDSLRYMRSSYFETFYLHLSYRLL